MKRSGKGKKRKINEGDEGDAGDEGEGEGWKWASGKVEVWPSRSKTLLEGEVLETGDGVMTQIS